MRIITWNINSLPARKERLFEVLKRHRPDILALQEIKNDGSKIPFSELEQLGYGIHYVGQKAYNGVAVLAQSALSPRCAVVATSFHTEFAAEARFMHMRIDAPEPFELINVYVPNGQSLQSEKYPYKLAFLKAMTKYIESLPSIERLLVVGDFNIVPADLDCYDPAYFGEDIFCSKPERQALSGMMEQGLFDLYREQYPERQEFSWWDYRSLSFPLNKGLRIDLILGGKAFKSQPFDICIDRDERKGDKPSDHVPVVIDFSATL